MNEEREPMEERIGREMTDRSKSGRDCAVDCMVDANSFWSMARRLNAKVELVDGPTPYEYMTMVTAGGSIRVVRDHDAPRDEPTFVSRTWRERRDGEPDGGLRVGAIVRLNSGSPRLTVEAVKDFGRVEVSWFNNGAIDRATFARETLRLDESEA